VKANATASLVTSRLTVARAAGTSVPYGVAISLGAAIAMSGALP
jgi:Flp pilus assembly protein protease CpaA